MSDTTSETHPVAGAIGTTADLAKSVGRFSLAMSLFTTRQVASMVAPSKSEGRGAMDDVSTAAGNQLTGPVRTAYAIGTNIQSGLVDAAFDLLGQGGPAGQAPHGDTSGLSIAMTERARRRVSGVRTVAQGALGRPIPQAEVVERLMQYHSESTGGAVERAKTVTGLWKSEGLATTIGKYLLDENTLADPRLAKNVLPIAHVGFGSGSTEALLFDPDKLKARFESRCDANHLGFAYEGIGAILRIYERGLFKVMSGSLGLIPLDAPDGPDATGFFASYLDRYPSEIQRLITHGYGRLVAFSNIDIYTAIQQATAFPEARVEPAVHGCGFAFVMMNSADLPRILENSAVPFDAPVRAAFQNGLIYSLVFFDWYAPGLLAGWQAAGPLEAELIDHARREAAAAERRGFLLPFRLETPRT